MDQSDPVWVCWTKHCVMLKHMYKEKYSIPHGLMGLHYAALDHFSTFTEVAPLPHHAFVIY